MNKGHLRSMTTALDLYGVPLHKLKPHDITQMLKIKNFGRVSAREVCLLAGIDPESVPQLVDPKPIGRPPRVVKERHACTATGTRWHFCPRCGQRLNAE